MLKGSLTSHGRSVGRPLDFDCKSWLNRNLLNSAWWYSDTPPILNNLRRDDSGIFHWILPRLGNGNILAKNFAIIILYETLLYLYLCGILFRNRKDVYIPFLDICYKWEFCCSFFLDNFESLPERAHLKGLSRKRYISCFHL